MISIVSGFMRTGTSMMMRALEAGGMEPVYAARRDQKMNDRWGDELYSPNQGGLYELDRASYQHPDFPGPRFDGKLIKLLVGGMFRLKAGDYRVVFMTRDPEEIRQSHEAFFGRPFDTAQYWQIMNRCTGILEQRRDVNLTVFRYEDVVANPLPAFTQLTAAGWPIDATVAAAVPDPDQHRFRLDQLEVGV